jgi:translation elongation factor EF-Tu-like GTPase
MSEIKVSAQLSLLASDEGGRRTAIGSGFRPNHNFGAASDTEFVIGQVDLVEGQRLEPGQTAEVVVRFVDAPGLREKLRPGREWRIQEAKRLMGLATVLDVLN